MPWLGRVLGPGVLPFLFCFVLFLFHYYYISLDDVVHLGTWGGGCAIKASGEGKQGAADRSSFFCRWTVGSVATAAVSKVSSPSLSHALTRIHTRSRYVQNELRSSIAGFMEGVGTIASAASASADVSAVQAGGKRGGGAANSQSFRRGWRKGGKALGGFWNRGEWENRG